LIEINSDDGMRKNSTTNHHWGALIGKMKTQPLPFVTKSAPEDTHMILDVIPYS